MTSSSCWSPEQQANDVSARSTKSNVVNLSVATSDNGIMERRGEGGEGAGGGE